MDEMISVLAVPAQLQLQQHLFWIALVLTLAAAWADNADNLSIEYTGSAALKTEFTRYFLSFFQIFSTNRCFFFFF